MRRILFYFSQNDLGGHTRFVVNLSRELEDFNFESHVYVPFFTHFYYQLNVLNGGRELKSLIRYFAGQVLRMVKAKFKWRGQKMNPSCNLRVKRFIFKPNRKYLESFDVIITSAAWHINEIEKVGYTNRDKILHVMHHPHTNQKMNLENYFLDKSIRVVVPSTETQKAVSSMGIVCELIHLGVDNSLATISATKKNTITFFYYKNPRKNPKLVEDLIYKSLTIPEASIIVLGNGFPHVPRSFKHRIRVIENVSDQEYFRLMAETKLFVYISLLEGFGLPPLEAMALGTTTIASSVGAIPEYGDHMRDLIILEQQQTLSEIFQLMVSVYQNEGLRLEIEKQSRKKSALFSMRACAEKYSSLLNKISIDS